MTKDNKTYVNSLELKELCLKKLIENKKAVKVKGKDYYTVASRHSHFLDYFPSASIKSDIISELCDENKVAVKVTISIHYSANNGADLGISQYTGLALERFDASFINKTSALENAETSALGRALAAFGLHGSEYCSADEVATAVKQQATIQKKAIKETKKNKIPVYKNQNDFINFLKKTIEAESKTSNNQKQFEDKMQPYWDKYEGDLAKLESFSDTLYSQLRNFYNNAKTSINAKGKTNNARL